MAEFDISAPLAAAVAARGYATLTPVQAAVLAPAAFGRDLLVSAQTGSGKTVAFGLAIAPEVLGENDRLVFANSPLALAIAPTRELALQVARELAWLYGEAGGQIATCVGGMDYRNEKRALDRGAHIVVGTPGRLRDHIERGSLDLSGLRACVLDEADEMLDLGFREDLEFILNAAPDDRRTLMFSATVPKAIAELAKVFQKDALRIQTAGEARQHVDIEYRALNVTARDREHAIFNVLRFYEARSAIVFCKTRANVNHLLARMANRGFQVVALSGELSQQERTHALQALRDGRARVCVATDVAARGIDLPGLDLVVHADLPTNSETLLHRSGRTGRAGSKGVSALIVTPAEFKKAQRLLQGAKVVADWGRAPSADEVQSKDDARILDHPTLAAQAGEEAELARDLLARFGAEQVASAFIRLWREGRSAPEELAETQPASPTGPREQRGEFGDSVWFTLSVGHAGRAEARWLLPKLCEAGGITRAAIGAIRVRQEETFVQIATADAARLQGLAELEVGISIRRLPGEPVLDQPARAPRRSETVDTARRGDHRDKTRDDVPKPVRALEKRAYTPLPPRIVEDEAARPVPAPIKRAAALEPLPRPVRDMPEARPEAGQKDPGEKRKARWTMRDRQAAKAAPRAAGSKSHEAPRAVVSEGRPAPFKETKPPVTKGGAAPKVGKGFASSARDKAPAGGNRNAAKPFAKGKKPKR